MKNVLCLCLFFALLLTASNVRAAEIAYIMTDKQGNVLLIFDKEKTGNVSKIRVMVWEKGGSRESGDIAPVYEGDNSIGFIIPKKIAMGHHFNILAILRNGEIGFGLLSPNKSKP